MMTCLAVTVLYYHYRPGFHQSKLRKIIAETSSIFADATFWLSSIAILAGCYYSMSNIKSLYEEAMFSLVTSLSTSANILSFLVLEYYRNDVPNSHSFPIHYIAMLVIWFGSLLIFFLQNSKLGYLPSEYIDAPCYIDGLGLLSYATRIVYINTICIWAGAACSVISLVLFLVDFLFSKSGVRGSQVKEFMQKIDRHQYLICYSCATSLYLIGLWFTFCAILNVKARARVAFGSSFEDDAFGYGQIIACGFAASAMLTFIYNFAGIYHSLFNH